MNSKDKRKQLAAWLTKGSERLSINVKKILLIGFVILISVYCLTLIFQRQANTLISKEILKENFQLQDIERVKLKILQLETLLDSIKRLPGGKSSQENLLKQYPDLLDSLAAWRQKVENHETK